MARLLSDHVLAEQESFLRDSTRNTSAHGAVESVFSGLRIVLQMMLWKATQIVLVHSGCYTKTPQTGQFIKNRNVFFTILEAGSPRSVNQHGHVGVFFQVADLLCPHLVEGIRELCSTSFIKTLIQFMRAPPS